jgi:FMN phosphatase YigB (HAD superfamily)
LTAWGIVEEKLGIPTEETRTVWSEQLQLPSDLGEITEDVIWETIASLRAGVNPRDVCNIFFEECVEVPFGVKLLETAKASGWHTVLATNTTSEWVARLRKRYQWLTLLDEVCCSAEIGFRKPEDEYYLKLLDFVSGDNPIFVDDKQVNLDAAQKHGFRTLLASNWGKEAPSREQ